MWRPGAAARRLARRVCVHLLPLQQLYADVRRPVPAATHVHAAAWRAVCLHAWHACAHALSYAGTYAYAYKDALSYACVDTESYANA